MHTEEEITVWCFWLDVPQWNMQQQSSSWDPQHAGDIQELDKVQHRAARWALNDYGWYSCVTLMFENLGWDYSQKKTHNNKITNIVLKFYKMSIPLAFYTTISPKQDIATRQNHPLYISLYYKLSYCSISTELLRKEKYITFIIITELQ